MVSNLDIVKKIGRATYNTTKNFTTGFIETQLVMPTTFRKFFASLEDNARNYGRMFGIMTIILPPGVCLGLYMADSKLAGAILGTYITTNLASGLYEIFRYTKQKMNSSQPQPKPSELEVKVEEPVETKPVKLKFVNPWEIEIKD